jgi:hypothetical protein
VPVPPRLWGSELQLRHNGLLPSYNHPFLAMPKPEAFSRVLIDQELRESGWDLLDEHPTRCASPDPIGTNVACALNWTGTAGEPFTFSKIKIASAELLEPFWNTRIPFCTALCATNLGSLTKHMC